VKEQAMATIDPLTAQRQIMFSLAYLAYAGEGLEAFPSPDATIASLVDDALLDTKHYPAIANQWTRVWGPVTWAVPGSQGQDNMMYVARATAPPFGYAQYAVAVRGTNGKVYLDWLIEDFDVLPMMAYSGNTSGGNISESTNIGITVLQQMVDPTSQATLWEFLAAEMRALPDGTAATVAFVGHSLGAALSSTLALLARDTQSAWDPASIATVTATNFAGPTAGDATFAAYLAQRFAIVGEGPSWWTSPSITPPSFCDFVRQPLDIAPLAWNQWTFVNAPSLYENIGVELGWGDGSVATTIVALINEYVGPKDYLQPNALAPELGSIADPDIPSNAPEGFTTFADEAEWQHTIAYAYLLRCEGVVSDDNANVPPVVTKLRAAALAK
jgi:pimeloyl-ACP methyl ester carboxylesterase